jgi:hypothetical protein
MAATNSPGFFTLGVLAVLAGCPTPAQEGGLARIDTDGLARRLEMVCSSGHADPSCPERFDEPTADAGSDAESAPEAGE